MSAISIAIVTFNSGLVISRCLDSLLSQTFQDFEVVVVDNGSTDRTVGIVESGYPGVRLIKNRDNQGACRGRNQAIDATKGEWVLTLDCDVVLAADFLEQIYRYSRSCAAQTGALQPVIFTGDRRTLFSCGITLGWSGRFYDRGNGCAADRGYAFGGKMIGGCAAACLYRRAMLEAVKERTGYFDERFFFLVEDVDLAWRAQEKGWKTVLCPGAHCFHTGNSSLTGRKERQYRCFKNRYLMLAKHRQPALLKALRFLAYEAPRFIFFFLTNPYACRAVREIRAAVRSEQ